MDNLIERDRQHLWHPCTQMKDYETFPPFVVESASGPYIHLADGSSLIDAASSWWCKSLGHNEPRLRAALLDQASRFEHVALSDATHEPIVQLSEKLCEVTGLDKAFYACDGSSATEIALKMSVHAHQLRGESARTHFATLENSYHGETLLALSVSDVGRFKAAYSSLLNPNVQFIHSIPYVNGVDDPLWHDCSSLWPAIEAQLETHHSHLAALIVEPLLQASGNMKVFSADFLRRLRRWTQARGIHLIADEIMTGLGRTGFPLACQHADITPDFICLGKGLTAGWLPLSAVMTPNAIYDLFYDDYATGKIFIHSHTHSGNALAAAVALKTLQVLEQDNIYAHVQQLTKTLRHHMQQVADQTGKLINIRSLGAVVAADLVIPPHCKEPRLGFKLAQEARKQGAFMRPLGNTLYWLPPLNSQLSLIDDLRDITIKSIENVYNHLKLL